MRKSLHLTAIMSWYLCCTAKLITVQPYIPGSTACGGAGGFGLESLDFQEKTNTYAYVGWLCFKYLTLATSAACKRAAYWNTANYNRRSHCPTPSKAGNHLWVAWEFAKLSQDEGLCKTTKNTKVQKISEQHPNLLLHMFRSLSF